MKQVEKLLFAKQDEAYGDFEARLIPNINRDTIIGVRVPDIREVAKNIMKTHPAWVPKISQSFRTSILRKACSTVFSFR